MSNTMPGTMAEAFCKKHLVTWTEHREEHTGWEDGDIYTRSNRMSRAGAISLFHPLEEDHLLIVTVFRDRSWIVQQEPMGGTPPIVGTREDEHRIPDLIHRTLEAGLAVLVYGDGSKVSDTTFAPNCSKRRSKRPRLEPSLSSASNMLFHLPPQGLIDTGPRAQNGVGSKVT